MGVDPALIERIYEAGALPERWPGVLSELGRVSGAAGGLFFTNTPSGVSWVVAPEAAWIIEEYVARGYMVDNLRGAPMVAELYPGFRTDSTYRSAEERAAIPVYRDFLIPNGIDAAAGTVFQGANDDALVLTLEHFPAHAHAIAAVPFLNQLRPHLGRALSLSARLREAEAKNAVAALQLAGVPAAVVSPDGRLRAVNERFGQRLGDRMIARAARVSFSDRFLQARFAEGLGSLNGDGGARSVAIAATDDKPAFAVHLVPLKRGARDVFGWDGVLLLLAEAANASVPNADLLRLLFDLTPAEARLTRHLIEGRTSAEAAALLAITEATARTHLRRIFAKTGVQRQAELVRLLLGLGGPA